MRCLTIILICALCLLRQSAVAQPSEHDVVVYGATSAGVIAAVEAKRHGKSVVLIGPDQHLGGLTAGGLGWTDTGNKAVIGGLAREFYHRIWRHYNDDQAWNWQSREQYGNRGQGTPAIDGSQRTMWIFEPHVAEQVFEALVAEHDIEVVRDQWLDREHGVVRNGNRITKIRMLDGRVYEGKMFIDATYEGDLMAAAGVDYHVGREANSLYGETWNGIQVGTLHHKHWFQTKISAYVTPGDPMSGLLERISSQPPGKKGEGDRRIQAYCYRMCLTNHDPNRIPFEKPEGYDPNQYQLLLRVLRAEWREVFEKFDPIPNFKTDTNNHGPFSTDNIGMNYAYPEASYDQRQEILDEHKRYQQGLFYFLANDPRVPDDVRAQFAQWGLAKDEFRESGGWPHQIYVRESRRIIGEYVMTEHDCLDKKATPKSIGMGSYTLDSHNVQHYVTPDGSVQNEGDIGVKVPRPYEISYDSIVPKRSQCENLLVPICISSSHIAFGSIRMEPVFMILGHSAAAAATIAIDRGIPVQDVSYLELSTHLAAEKQVLGLEDASRTFTTQLPGVVVDDSAATLTGNWHGSSSNKPYVGFGYSHDGDADKGNCTAIFQSGLEPGEYEVRISFTPHPNRASNTPVSIQHRGGTTKTKINQRSAQGMDGMWLELGRYRFDKQGAVHIENAGTDGHVIVDAVQWLPAK